MKVCLGDKFYIYDEKGNLIMHRVIKFKNENDIVMKCLNNGQEFHTTVKEIMEDDGLRKLLPDAYIVFNIVDLQDNNQDVIVSLFNRKGYEEGIKTPYAICRQSVEDVFSNQIKLKGDNNFYVGCSVSVNTVPEGIDFKMFTACNGLRYNITVSTYMNDKFEDIMSLIRSKKFDIVLRTLSSKNKNPSVYGYTDNLRDLLDYTVFMYDFRQCFDILPVDININPHDTSLPIEQIQYIEFLMQREIYQNNICKYTKKIDLSKIDGDYTLISDINEEIYLLRYDAGNYLTLEDRQNIRNKRDAVLMIKNMQKNK